MENCDYHDLEEKIKQLEAEKLNDDSFIRALFSKCDAIQIICDKATGTIVDANFAACKYYGYAMDEIIGLNINALTDTNHETFSIANNVENCITYSQRHKTKHGEFKDVEVYRGTFKRSGVELISLIIIDTTKFTRHEIELLKSTNLLHSVLERVSDAFVAFDKDFNYTYVNSNGAAVLGRTDLVGKNYWKEYPEAKGTPFANAYVRAFETQEPIFLEDYYVHWDRWFLNRIYPSPDGITIFFTDITNQKKIELELVAAKEMAENSEKELHKMYSELQASEEELRAANEELLATTDALKLSYEELYKAKEKAEESDKLKSTFLQNMSHEVRTPLNAINGFAELIAKPNQSQENIGRFSELIAESSTKLIEIMTDIIEISQVYANQVSIKRKQFDVIKQIEQIVNLYAKQAKDKDINLVVINSVELDNRIISSDEQKVKRIFTHLIDNAIKFTHQGKVEIVCKQINNHLSVEISDTGIGIAPEMQPIIFQPFRQVEIGICRNFGGNGLGLSIVKAYVELLDGKLTLVSEPNKGTKVTVTLPQNYSTIELNEKMNKTKSQTGVILIAEDEYNNYLYLAELLSEANLKFVHAENGKKAVELCNTQNISLVLMDIKMPIMSGIDATKLIKQTQPELPVIAQTAYALQSEIEQFIDIFDDYVTKPIHAGELFEKVNRYIRS